MNSWGRLFTFLQFFLFHRDQHAVQIVQLPHKCSVFFGNLMGPGCLVKFSESTTRFRQAINRFIFEINLAFSRKICGGGFGLGSKEIIEQVLRDVRIWLHIVLTNCFFFKLNSIEGVKVSQFPIIQIYFFLYLLNNSLNWGWSFFCFCLHSISSILLSFCGTFFHYFKSGSSLCLQLLCLGFAHWSWDFSFCSFIST